MMNKKKIFPDRSGNYLILLIIILLSACSLQKTLETVNETETPFSPKSVFGEGEIISREAPSRASPDHNADVLGIYDRGQRVDLLWVTFDEKWYYVQTEELGEGWVFAEFIQILQPYPNPPTSIPLISPYPLPYPGPVTTTPTEMIIPDLTITPLKHPTETPCSGYDCYFPPPFPGFTGILKPVSWIGFGLLLGWSLILADGSDGIKKILKR
jgi:hypothetical protein